MTELTPIGRPAPGNAVDRVSASHARDASLSPRSADTNGRDERGDRVEISRHARGNTAAGGQSPETTEARKERIAAIRNAIEDGSYDTQSRLGVAVSRLLDDVGGANTN